MYGVGLDVEVRRINMQLIMQLEKRADGLTLRNLAACLSAQDAAGAGVLDFDAFVLGLKKYNIFPTVVEIQALMKFYNKGDEKNPLIDYMAFVNGLRLPLKDRRLGIVKEAFCKINPEAGADCITVGQAKAAFAYEQFDKWCECLGAPADDEGHVISWDDFNTFYADVSMTVFDDKKFIALVENSWSVAEAAHIGVT